MGFPVQSNKCNWCLSVCYRVESLETPLFPFEETCRSKVCARANRSSLFSLSEQHCLIMAADELKFGLDKLLCFLYATGYSTVITRHSQIPLIECRSMCWRWPMFFFLRKEEMDTKQYGATKHEIKPKTN